MSREMNLATMETHWGFDNLTRWRATLLESVNIPSDAKEFLAAVGLPSPGREICGWLFDWAQELPRLDSNRRILGWERETQPILIDQDGRIVWGREEEGDYERHINSTVEQFAASLIEMDKFYQASMSKVGQTYDAADVERRLDSLEIKLRTIDASAIADGESLWSAIIHSVRLELS